MSTTNDNITKNNVDETSNQNLYSISTFEKHLTLPLLITQQQWKHVTTRLSTHPQETQEYYYHFLPFTLACSNSSTPMNIVEQIYQIYPSAISTKDLKNHLLPLQWAMKCLSPNVSVIHFLVTKYPQGILSVDGNGMTPLLYYLAYYKEPMLNVVKICTQGQSSQIMKKVDVYGWTILHHAVYKDALDIVEYILEESSQLVNIKDIADLVPREYCQERGGKLWKLLLKEEEKWSNNPENRETEEDSELKELHKNIQRVENKLKYLWC